MDKVVLLEEPIIEYEVKKTAWGYIPGKMKPPSIKMRLPKRILRKFYRSEYKHYGPEPCTYNGKKYLIHGIYVTTAPDDSIIGQINYYLNGVECPVDYFETY